MKRLSTVISLLLCFVSASFLHASSMQLFVKEQREASELNLLIEVSLDQGEYSYWINPGEGGYSPSIDWELPANVTLEEVIWETPKPFYKLGQYGYGYSQKMRALAKLKLPESLESDVGNVKLSFLTCNESACVPKESEASFEIRPLQVSQKSQRINQEKFELLEKSLPIKDERLVAKIEGQKIIVELPIAKEFQKAWVLPYNQGVILPGAEAKIAPEEQSVIVSAPLESGVSQSFEGIVLVQDKGRYKSWELKQAAFTTSVAKEIQQSHHMGIFLAVILAFLGGVILNVMPCVFPVLSLKILSFVELSKKESKTVLRYGIYFTLGVLVSFWALGCILILLRHYGSQVGWGFQLQHPIFVALMLLLFFIMSLNLFGLFEWGGSFTKLGKYQRSKGGFSVFLSGVFATLVATPCTGPLLGPTLGLALTLEPSHTLFLLSMVGLGLAAPYLLFSMFPKWLRFFPKPGSWLETFKQFLGFLLMASAIWFFWVLNDQIASSSSMLQILLALLVVAIGVWFIGKVQRFKRSRFRRVLAILVFCLGVFLMIDGVSHKEDVTSIWQPYNQAHVEELLQKNQPVFIDFTAKWCLICQTNKVVLESNAVQEAFRKYHVVTMRADWTKKDPEITKALAAFGRSGVPLYVLYRKGEQPIIFPQILSQTSLIKEIEDSYAH